MSDLSAALCSITPTQRRRYFWAVWWTGAPRLAPFRKPDASGGGAATEQAALVAAERAAGRHLVMTEPYWARAWNRVLRGEAPPPRRPPRTAIAQPAASPARSAWAILELAPGASLAEVRQAFRRLALETHPDHGGDAARFREVQAAYARLVARLARSRARR